MLAFMVDRKFWDFGLVKMFQFVCFFFFSIYFTYLKLRVLMLIFLSHNI